MTYKCNDIFNTNIRFDLSCPVFWDMAFSQSESLFSSCLLFKGLPGNTPFKNTAAQGVEKNLYEQNITDWSSIPLQPFQDLKDLSRCISSLARLNGIPNDARKYPRSFQESGSIKAHLIYSSQYKHILVSQVLWIDSTTISTKDDIFHFDSETVRTEGGILNPKL